MRSPRRQQASIACITNREAALRLFKGDVSYWHKASILECPLNCRFSNRPFGVKRFQTIHRRSVDVASRARASLRNRHQGPCMGFIQSRSLSRMARLSSIQFFSPCRAGLLRMCSSGHTLTASSMMAPLGPVGMTIRGGARFRARFNRATTLYPVGPRTRTTMQSCASAAKLRSGGPILPIGFKAKGLVGNPPPRTVIGLSQAYEQGRNCRGVFSVLRSSCRTQNDAVRYNALPHESPQGDQKLARQGHDHGLARTESVLGTNSIPLR